MKEKSTLRKVANDYLTHTKYQSGITLVALVITIIVLLILAGITIATLNSSELFKKTNQAVEINTIAELLEDLKIKVYNIQIEKNGNATLQDFIDYLSKDTENEYLISLSKFAIVSGITNIGNANEIYILYKNYQFRVDNLLNIEYIEMLPKTEGTYEIVSNNSNNNYTIAITLKNSLGIQKILTPEGNIINGNNENEVSFNYDVNSEKEYKFTILSNDKETEITLDATRILEISITETTSSAYPIITKTGVDLGKIITIEYGQQDNNYYSLDDGITWIEYSGKININSACTIKAKSKSNDEIDPIISKPITMQLASDALGSKGYDNSTTTNTTLSTTSTYVMVDEEMIGQKIDIKFTNVGNKTRYLKILAVNSSKDVNSPISTLYNGYNSSLTATKTYTIPTGTKYIVFYCVGITDGEYVYEVMPAP